MITHDDDDDAPPTPEELAAAARLAALVDGLDGGVPAVLAAEDRPLLETAARIRSTRELSRERREELLRGVFVPPLRRRVLGPLVAVMAAAAVLLLVVRPPRSPGLRSASAVVGRIDATAAADAGSRLDALYADRLASYRTRILAGGTR